MSRDVTCLRFKDFRALRIKAVYLATADVVHHIGQVDGVGRRINQQTVRRLYVSIRAIGDERTGYLGQRLHVYAPVRVGYVPK